MYSFFPPNTQSTNLKLSMFKLNFYIINLSFYSCIFVFLCNTNIPQCFALRRMVQQGLNDFCFGPLFIEKVTERFSHGMWANVFQSDCRASIMNDSPQTLAVERFIRPFSTREQITVKILLKELIRKFLLNVLQNRFSQFVGNIDRIMFSCFCSFIANRSLTTTRPREISSTSASFN